MKTSLSIFVVAFSLSTGMTCQKKEVICGINNKITVSF